MKMWTNRREVFVPSLVAAAVVAGLTIVGAIRASDHQDTPTVELSPRYDVNDVYAFPTTPGRMALVLGTSSPITPPHNVLSRSTTRHFLLFPQTAVMIRATLCDSNGMAS